MKERVFSKNEVIFREGDRAEHFYQVKEGTAGVYANYGQADQRKLTEVKPGSYFGEMAIIDVWPRSATVVAEEELHTIELTGSELNEYFGKEPDKILTLMKNLQKEHHTSILMISHDLAGAMEDATHILSLGKTVFCGTKPIRLIDHIRYK